MDIYDYCINLFMVYYLNFYSILVLLFLYLLYKWCRKLNKMKEKKASYDVEIATKRKFHSEKNRNKDVSVKMNPILQRQIRPEAFNRISDEELEYISTEILKKSLHLQHISDAKEYFESDECDEIYSSDKDKIVLHGKTISSIKKIKKDKNINS